MRTKSTTAHRYLTRFFDEKDLPFAQWTIETDAGAHIISNEVVIETILEATPHRELVKIADTLRRIDFANGDCNHFLRHLAGALASNHA